MKPATFPTFFVKIDAQWITSNKKQNSMIAPPTPTILEKKAGIGELKSRG